MAVKLTTPRGTIKSNGIKCLVYGASGVGKTRLCATAPKPLIISAEGGLLSLYDEEIPCYEVNSVAQINEILSILKSSKKIKDNVKTVCFDSLTEIGEIVLEEAIPEYKDRRQAYFDVSSIIIPLIKKFRDLQNYNVIMTCKLGLVKDEESGILFYGPDMPGHKVGQQLPYLFDEVFRMTRRKNKKGEQQRILCTEGGKKFDAKDRSGALNDIERANMTDIFNKILRK